MSGIRSWSSFFVAEVGAAAALAGLLFVSISLNIGEILKSPKLPARAAETIAMLVGALIAASLALLPHQSLRTLGIELVTVGGVSASLPLTLLWRHREPIEGEPHVWMASRVLITVLGTVVAPVAGIVLIAGGSWGLYVLAAAILTTFAVAVINAWVFLVEILR